MSDLADRLSELVEAHNVAMCGNLGVPGMPDHIELKCPTCGPIPDDGRQVFKQHATHVGAVVAAYVREHFTDHAEELGLSRERGSIWVETDGRCPCGVSHLRVVEVSASRYMTDWVRDA